jgi:hypothetical protein
VAEITRNFVAAINPQTDKLLRELTGQRIVKEYYSTAEIARILKRAEYTVREWCRNHRIVAEKKLCGRGNTFEWKISHLELERIKNDGLLPL